MAECSTFTARKPVAATVFRGETFERTAEFTIDSEIWDLTGYTATATIEPAAIPALTVGNGGITLDAAAGKVTMTVTDEQTAGMQSRTYRLVLKLTDSAGKSYIPLRVDLRIENP